MGVASQRCCLRSCHKHHWIAFAESSLPILEHRYPTTKYFTEKIGKIWRSDITIITHRVKFISAWQAKLAVQTGSFYSVEWNGGMEWWNGTVEWNSGMTTPIERLL